MYKTLSMLNEIHDHIFVNNTTNIPHNTSFFLTPFYSFTLNLGFSHTQIPPSLSTCLLLKPLVSHSTPKARKASLSLSLIECAYFSCHIPIVSIPSIELKEIVLSAFSYWAAPLTQFLLNFRFLSISLSSKVTDSQGSTSVPFLSSVLSLSQEFKMTWLELALLRNLLISH